MKRLNSQLSWEQKNLVLQPHKEQILELQDDLCCCVSHRRIRARRWPAGSRRPLPAAPRGPASWHYLVACSWCWRRWTRSTCPASAEATSSRTETREQTIFSFRSWRNAVSAPSCSSSPCGRCCPPRWTSCCFPACPSEWSPADRKAWARCHTVWRTSSTPQCRPSATLCHPGDSTPAGKEWETN